MKVTAVALLALAVTACGSAPPSRPASPSPSPTIETLRPAVPATSTAACGSGGKLRVHFFDAGQALAVLLTLPDGRHVLVDAGESPRRPCKGCKAWHERVMSGLRQDLGSGGLDALWITHQHSDHVGGAEDVLKSFTTKLYVDNGLDLEKTDVVRKARAAVAATGAKLHVVDPDHRETPIAAGGGVTFTPVVPSSWPSACPGDPNACSIALRVDYCKSSVLFTGDAPDVEEDAFDFGGEVSLLQVGHHGSNTSSGDGLLKKAKPRYAVISAGKPDEGTNDGYCHPARSTIEHLNATLGGAGSHKLSAFNGASCKKGVSHLDQFVEVPASDRIWATERDGDVALVTTGDGVFVRE